MYINMNRLIANIESVYESNLDISILQEQIDAIQTNVTDYLNTKSSDSLEDYYRNEQAILSMVEQFNDQILDNSFFIMEKNIRNVLQTYLDTTAKAIDYKRGRNIEKYTEYYEKGNDLYHYLYSLLYTQNTNQFMKNSNNYSILLSSLKYSEIINLTILLVVGAFSILLVILLTRGITGPLKRLADAANQVAQGNLDIKILYTQSRDEIGTVTMAFQQMLASLRLYIEKVKETAVVEQKLKEKELVMETHMKEAQLRYLQAQINPHFLFNTLNAGAQLAMMENANRTYDYVQSIATFYRYNIGKNNGIVTRSEERRVGKEC